MRSSPSGHEGIDIADTEKVSHLVDGMVTTPVAMIDGAVHISETYRYETPTDMVDIIKAKIAAAHNSGTKAYLRGVYPSEKMLRMTVPL